MHCGNVENYVKTIELSRTIVTVAVSGARLSKWHLWGFKVLSTHLARLEEVFKIE